MRLKSAPGDTHGDHAHAFEELAILDSAGRLSLPRDYLDHFQIRRRVRLELVDNGILIRPAKVDHAELQHTYSSSGTIDFSEEVGEIGRMVAWISHVKEYFQKLIDKLRKGNKDAK